MELVRLRDAASGGPEDEVIEGLLDDGLVILAAPEGSGKTFLAIHMGVHVATGHSWNGGKEVKQGGVVYCIAEGVSFFPYRVTTALERNCGVESYNVPFFLHSNGGDLVTRDGHRSPFVEELRMEILKLEGITKVNTRLIVFDTLNMFMPGADENSQKETGGLIDGCRYLRQELDHPTIILVHHFNKAGLVRGSTVLTGAADQTLVCRPSGPLKDAPVRWTTDRTMGGKRKDRDPVDQWFKFDSVFMVDGTTRSQDHDETGEWDGFIMEYKKETFPIEEGNPDTDYGFRYLQSHPKETLIMRPCEKPEGVDEETGSLPANYKSIEKVKSFLTQNGPSSVRNIIKSAKMAQASVYKALDYLSERGDVMKDEKTKVWKLVTGKENPFEEA